MRLLGYFLLTACLLSATSICVQAGVLVSGNCNQECEEAVRNLVVAERALFPVLALPVETFEPDPSFQCRARPGPDPIVHATIVAPFYRNFVELPGTQNDAKLWHDLFSARGVDDAELRVLDGDQVTRDKFVTALSATVACVRERDLVVVTFSGGATTRDLWGAKAARLIEEYCTEKPTLEWCMPARQEGSIRHESGQVEAAELAAGLLAPDENDLILFSSETRIVLDQERLGTGLGTSIAGVRASELSNFATLVRNRGGDVIFILDTNYAALSNLLERQESAALTGSWRWDRDMADGTQGGRPGVELFGTGNFAAFYAARRDQMAMERSQTGGLALGELTYAMAEALRSIPSPTIEQLARETDRIMADASGRQVPVFESTDPAWRFLTTRDVPQANPDQIDIINPKMRSAVAIAEPQLEVIARYSGTGRAAFASIDGVNVEIDPSGQFRRTVSAQSRLELPVRVYGDKAVLLAERRIQFDIDATDASLAPSGRRFALIIGNQNYENFGTLANPIADAEAVHKILVEQFGFSTALEIAPGKRRDLFLKDATATDIKRALFDLRKVLIAEDQLLVYYAGHGEQDSESTSYWVPVDATSEDFTWIAASEISEDLRKLAAGSVLLISDSCYAGGLSRSLEGEKQPEEESRGRFLAKAAQYKARQLIASGGDEPVQDGGGGSHSLFARALLEGLAEMPDSVFTASELFNAKVKPKAIEFAFSSAAQGQTPAHLRLSRAGDQPESEFIFVRK